MHWTAFLVGMWLATFAYFTWRCYRLEQRIEYAEEFISTVAPDWELLDSMKYGPPERADEEPLAPQAPRLRPISRRPKE